MKKYLRFCRGLNNVTIGIAIALLISAVTLTFVQVCTRNFANYSFRWGEELTRYLIIFCVFFSSGYVFSIDANAKVEVILNRFPPKAKRVVLIIFCVLIALFCIVMCYYAYMLMQKNLRTWCASIRIPWAVPFSSLLIGGVNVLLQIPAKIYTLVTGTEQA